MCFVKILRNEVVGAQSECKLKIRRQIKQKNAIICLKQEGSTVNEYASRLNCNMA